MRMKFKATYYPDDNGTVRSEVEGLPGCNTYGEDIEDCRKHTQDAICTILDAMDKDGELPHLGIDIIEVEWP